MALSVAFFQIGPASAIFSIWLRALVRSNTFTHAQHALPGKVSQAKAMMGGDLAMDIANTRLSGFVGHNLYEEVEVADTAS